MKKLFTLFAILLCGCVRAAETNVATKQGLETNEFTVSVAIGNGKEARFKSGGTFKFDSGATVSGGSDFKIALSLGNVDNTSDANKPVSTLQAAADSAVSAFAIQRANHTGTQLAATISDFAAAVAAAAPPQTITLTGDVTGSGTGSFATTLATVTVAKGGTGTTDRTLTSSDSNVAVDWENRRLKTASGTLLDWADGSFKISDANGTLQYQGGATRRLFDTTGAAALSFRTRALITAAGVSVLDWSSQQQRDTSSVLSVDWGNRLLKSSAGTTSIDWSARTTKDASAVTSIDWNSRYLMEGVHTSVDWGQRWLIASTASATVNWESQNLFDSAGSTSVDWGNRVLKLANGSSSADWGNGILYDVSSTISINYGARSMIDGGGTASVSYGTRDLIDSSANAALNWDERKLYAADGTSIALAWANNVVVPVTVYVKSLAVLTAGSPDDIGTITLPSNITRWHVISGQTNAGLAETASGTLAASAYDIRTATGGGGVSVATMAAGPTAAGSAVALSVSPSLIVNTASTLTVRQTANSANAGTLSFYITIYPLP